MGDPNVIVLRSNSDINRLCWYRVVQSRITNDQGCPFLRTSPLTGNWRTVRTCRIRLRRRWLATAPRITGKCAGTPWQSPDHLLRRGRDVFQLRRGFHGVREGVDGNGPDSLPCAWLRAPPAKFAGLGGDLPIAHRGKPGGQRKNVQIPCIPGTPEVPEGVLVCV